MMGILDALAGNVSEGTMTGLLTKGMSNYISGIGGVAGQFGDLAKQSIDFGSGLNVAQRGLLQNQASNAAAMGSMQAQRMAAQQGMGGSGLLQQAQQNQAYTNMMGAADKGLQAYLSQQKLGANYLGQQGSMLQQAGSMQSDLNTSLANAASERAANRGKMFQDTIGFVANAVI